MSQWMEKSQKTNRNNNNNNNNHKTQFSQSRKSNNPLQNSPQGLLNRRQGL
jgi:hypothetical protein